MAHVDCYKALIYCCLLNSFQLSPVILCSLRLEAPIVQRPSCKCKCNASPISFPGLCTKLSISHTRLHISRWWILRASAVTSIPMATATTTPVGLLRATHPQTLRHGGSPPLIHWRHHWLRSARLPRASAASYDATKDRKQQKTADTTAYPDNKVAIVMNPAANLFGSG